MRANGLFWLTIVSGLGLLVLGYVGFVTFMPDKTTGGLLILVFLLSFLMLLAGAASLLGALLYALVKAAIERKRNRAEGV
jgi:hypothetical protein